MAAGWEEGRNGELLIFRFLPPPGERDSFEDRARRAVFDTGELTHFSSSSPPLSFLPQKHVTF